MFVPVVFPGTIGGNGVPQVFVPFVNSKQNVVVPLNPLGPIGPGTVLFSPFLPGGPGGPGTVEFAPGFPGGPAGPGEELTLIVMVAFSDFMKTAFALLMVIDFCCASAAPLVVPAIIIAATKTSRDVDRTL